MVGNEPSKIDRQTSWVINSQHWYNCSMMGILDDILWSPWIKYLSSMVSFFSRALGTPNNDIWPEVESLPDYKNTFPKWKSGNLSSMVKNLDKNGIDLLAVRFHHSPWFYSDWFIMKYCCCRSPVLTCLFQAAGCFFVLDSISDIEVTYCSVRPAVAFRMHMTMSHLL